MQVFRRRGVGLRLVGNLSLTIGGEFMVGKREWVRDLEEKQAENLIRNDDVQEISASHKKILDDGIGGLWEEIKHELQETIANTELQRVRFTTAIESKNALQISAYHSLSADPIRVIVVVFQPNKYKFEVMENGRPAGNPVFVSVSKGNLAILNQNGIIAYDAVRISMAAAVCRALLEPFLQAFADDSSLSTWNRL